MIAVRATSLLAMSAMTSPALFLSDCSDDPPTGVCTSQQPVEGCGCEVEGELGCPADGETHSEAFVCVDGVWTDLSGTPQGDAAFCGSELASYGGCQWNPADPSMSVMCAVPGFIGISRSRRRAAAAARRVRAN